MFLGGWSLGASACIVGVGVSAEQTRSLASLFFKSLSVLAVTQGPGERGGHLPQRSYPAHQGLGHPTSTRCTRQEELSAPFLSLLNLAHHSLPLTPLPLLNDMAHVVLGGHAAWLFSVLPWQRFLGAMQEALFAIAQALLPALQLSLVLVTLLK